MQILSTLPVLDPATVNEIRSLDPELFQQLSQLMMESAPQWLNEIGVFISRKDGANLARVAHHMKSAASSMGASCVARCCGELELCGKKETMDLAPAWLERLQTSYADLTTALNAASAKAA